MKNKFGLLHKNFISAYAFFLLTALAFFCGRIYTIFTHGETSESLSLVWGFLLVFGTIFRVLAAVVLTLLKRRTRRIASDIYDSGVITYTAGMTVRGVFEIFGTDKNLILYYEVVGIGLMVIGFILIVVCSRKILIYGSEINLFELFINERTTERIGARIEAGELYSLHIKWAKKNGYFPLSKRTFYNEFTKRRYNVLRSGIADFTVVGIALRDKSLNEK